MKAKERTSLEVGREISECLEEVRQSQGWTVDDLANYVEINSMTLRNSLYKAKWSDLVVTILKLKTVISPDLAYEYKKALEREKISRRKEMARSE